LNEEVRAADDGDDQARPGHEPLRSNMAADTSVGQAAWLSISRRAKKMPEKLFGHIDHQSVFLVQRRPGRPTAVRDP